MREEFELIMSYRWVGVWPPGLQRQPGALDSGLTIIINVSMLAASDNEVFCICTSFDVKKISELLEQV